MATNTNNKTKTRSATQAKSNNTKLQAEPKNDIEAESKIIPKDVDLSQYITVRNGFQGRLVYRSGRTGERFVWDEFGSEQEIELRELKNAKNSAKFFFINNWFMFDDEWVIDFLGMRQFYKNAVSIEDFDNLFDKKADEVRETISGMSAGQKRSAAYRARQLISEKKIDSISVISAIEDALGIELVER